MMAGAGRWPWSVWVGPSRPLSHYDGRMAPPACRSQRQVRGRRGWLLAGYAGVAGFVALECALRQPGSASSLEASRDDHGTTRLIVTAYLLAAALPPLLRRVPLRSLPEAAAPVGAAVETAGLVVRAWSMRTLGASYSRTLRTKQAQPVVDEGPYRLIRHPGYLGSLVTWIGFALTSRSLPVVVAVAGLLASAYRQRINAEERLLRRDLPGYLDYSRRTKKLVPFLW